jgi:2-polyprenyl-3-methyl-5-hydroxy-6-metoxy-1,4-benzoquinol methylase
MEIAEGESHDSAQEHIGEVRQGKRFEFGKNWSNFLNHLSEEQIIKAEASLRSMLELPDLTGMRFLDVGSGSGLFSLAARRLGAQVHSFDYDPQSVACTKELRRRYFGNDPQWRVEQQSVMDQDYMASIGLFHVVYSWGVLHHTGRMWQALEYVQRPVAKGGLLFIAIYNDMGSQSARWRRVKQIYNQLPPGLRTPYTVICASQLEIKAILSSVINGRPGDYFKRWGTIHYRGMSHWRDLVDWIGGYPYEAAKPDEIFEYFRSHGFTLRRLKCGDGLGCNEFVFKRDM